MGDLSDFDEDGGDKSASSLLGVKISSVFASIQTSIPYPNFTITVSVVKNSTQGLPQTVGFCMGTSPHPTLENAVFVNEEKSGYMNNYASVLGGLIGYIGILKPATRYFIRPYHKEGNKVIYYQEQSVETLGGEISLELKETSPQHFSLRYDIKKQGTYRMYAQYRIVIMTNSSMMSWERRVKAVAVLLLTLAAYPTHGGKFTSCGERSKI